jgi:hypothetical protein
MTRLVNRIASKIKVLPQIRVHVIQDETRRWCTADAYKNTFVMQQVGAGPPGKNRGLLGCLRERGLHLKLDNMPGPTAAVLRRERFANWGKWYEMKQWGQAWHSWEPKDGSRSAIVGFEQEIKNFEYLYRDMRAWNPWSTFHFDECKNCARSDDSWEQELRLKMEADQPLHIHQDGWYKKTWAKRYPKGIPPRNSQEYRDHVEKYEDPGMQDSTLLNKDGIGHEYEDTILPRRLGGWHGR